MGQLSRAKRRCEATPRRPKGGSPGGLLPVILWITFAGTVLAQTAGKPPMDEETLAAGKAVYDRRCWFCHGEEGDGFGPVAEFLDPRPRDFTLGTYKLRTTESGELPTDEDLFRTVSRGIPGTAMPEWEPYLSVAERWQVVRYIQSFAFEFGDPEFDPYQKLVAISDPIPATADSIARGRDVFEQAKCSECHGLEGRGDGQKSSGMEDDWGYPLRIRNLTKGWTLKGGTEPRDIFTRFSTGINGTPMPSFIKSISEEDRWHLANYISREVVRNPSFEEVQVEAARIEGELPTDPWAPQWDGAEALDIPLAGQLLAAPRWQNQAVEMVSLKVLYNAAEIAFLAIWDDPYEDRMHLPESELEPGAMAGTYAEPFSDALVRQTGNLRDALALQFPVRAPDGPRKPHFFRGGASQPVQLWLWQSDRRDAGQPPVRVMEARGFERPLKELGGEQQTVAGAGVWRGGQWRVVMKRNLEAGDRDPKLGLGQLIPVAVEAWEGANGEHGLLMSLSTWHYVYLKPPTRPQAYVFALLGILAAALAEWWLIRRLRRK